MTLHNISHYNKYEKFWKESFWTHYIAKEIDTILHVVHPINQEILIKYPYDKKFMDTIPSNIKEIQELMYKYIDEYEEYLD